MFKVRRKVYKYKLIKELKKYKLNWDDFFTVNNIKSKLSPVEYFVENVNQQNLIIPNVLDVEYYLKSYPDVNSEVINPLLHYLKYGKKENRKAFPSLQEKIPQISEQQIKHDFSAILACSTIDWQPYIETHSLKSTEEAVAHFTTYWPTLLPEVCGVIDTRYYVEQYPDVWEKGENPLVHFIKHGEGEGRLPFPVNIVEDTVADTTTLLESNSLIEQAHTVVCEFENELRSISVAWDDFSKNYGLSTNSEPISFILENEHKMMLKIPRFFDSKLYLELYPDIANASISPLRHYLMHGRAEGRTGYFDLKKHFELGEHAFDKAKALYVTVSHESSATGAPLVGFNLSRQIAEKYNVVNIVLRKNKLQEAFVKESVACISDLHVQSPVLAKKALQYIAKEFKQIDGIICNSVETAYVLQAANELDIPTVSLVHEFSEYTRPVGKITNTVFNADKVIVPAQVIKDSMCRELKSYRGVKVVPNNIAIQPQGRLPFIPEGHGNLDTLETLKAKLDLHDDKDTHVLVGAGYVQIRKGVDLFIAAAKRIKELTNKPCKFVWVGEGYDPETDLNYANWVQTQITLNNLEDDVVFLGHQRNLDNVMQLADVFCMTSRLDPFPNVVIDALDADAHVACFEQSTGCAQFLKEHNANASVAPYLDIENFAKQVSQYLNGNTEQLGINSRIVEEHLNFDSYTKFVLKELQNASDFRKLVQKQVEALQTEGSFDASFYEPELSPEQALKQYVQLGLKGIHLYNPKAGFNDNQWLFEKGKKAYQVPLFEAIVSNDKTYTHKVECLIPKSLNKPSSISFKYAVHLHLYYVGLATEFVDYFKQLPSGFDLFITYVDESKTEEIKSAFQTCGANKIALNIVENKGRDVAPLFSHLKRDILDGEYEVIGHFHSKKSYEVSEAMGDSWRNFLMQTLIGTKVDAAHVLSQFNDANIGLVFADDRHCIDEGSNREFIDKLCEDMKIPSPTNTSLFPLGTMFWGRTKALLPIFELDFDQYVQAEPLPYDGSYMHSVERVIPSVVCNVGYDFITISKENVMW